MTQQISTRHCAQVRRRRSTRRCAHRWCPVLEDNRRAACGWLVECVCEESGATTRREGSQSSELAGSMLSGFVVLHPIRFRRAQSKGGESGTTTSRSEGLCRAIPSPLHLFSSPCRHDSGVPSRRNFARTHPRPFCPPFLISSLIDPAALSSDARYRYRKMSPWGSEPAFSARHPRRRVELDTSDPE